MGNNPKQPSLFNLDWLIGKNPVGTSTTSDLIRNRADKRKDRRKTDLLKHIQQNEDKKKK